MKNHDIQTTQPSTKTPSTPKLPYAPPTATFVPLKLEERILRCSNDRGAPLCYPKEPR